MRIDFCNVGEPLSAAPKKIDFCASPKINVFASLTIDFSTIDFFASPTIDFFTSPTIDFFNSPTIVFFDSATIYFFDSPTINFFASQQSFFFDSPTINRFFRFTVPTKDFSLHQQSIFSALFEENGAQQNGFYGESFSKL